MADENDQTPTNNDSQQPPAGGTPSNQMGNPGNPSSAEISKMAEELGRTKAEKEKLEAEYKDYVTRVDPVVQTLITDQELMGRVVESNNKRLGVETDPKKDSNDIPDLPVKDKETRNYLISQEVQKFYERNGINNLPKEEKEALDQKISMTIRETLNPTGGKTLSQIFEDVPLDTLPSYLDKAYFWTTRDSREKQIKEETLREFQTEGLGVIGGMPSGSGDSGDVTLTAKEMDTIRKAGWSVEKYLENKKELLKRNNQLY